MVKKSENAYRNISEASEIIGVKAHVLRFWESKFDTLNPMTRGGGRRFYSPDEIALLQTIKELLYERGMTIKAASALIGQYGTNAIYLAPDKVKPSPAAQSDSQSESNAEETASETVTAEAHDLNSENLHELQSIDLQLAVLERQAKTDIARLNAMLEKLDQAA